MRVGCRRVVARAALLSLSLSACFLIQEWAFAAATPTTQLFTQRASGSPFNHGDYVSTANGSGLNTYYSYFIEVPPGTAALSVQVFDPDIGAGAGGNPPAHDAAIGGGGYDTAAVYTLRDPTGALIITRATGGAGSCGGGPGFGAGSGCNNAWSTLWTQGTPPTAGHWEIRVDMSAGVQTGGGDDDVNGYGLRANDGIAGAGGTELNIYAESYIVPGAFASTNRTYNLHPYVDAGCEADSNDFDSDNGGGFGASYTYNSRSAAFTQTFTGAQVSGDGTWANNTMNGWTTDSASVEYGIWAGNFTVTAGAGSNNTATLYVGAFNAANPPTGGAGPPPTAQPEANTDRIYFRTDGNAAPVKPYAEQLLTYVSGPNPPAVGLTTRVQVTVRVVNPAPFAVTFSATNLVTANVPGGGAVYAGNAAVSQGAIVAQPAIGGTGNVTWNPGILAAGATRILTYQVDVTPTAAGQRIPTTGTPALNGTTARFVDETGNAVQARATFTFGPLCELAVTQGLLTHVVIASFRAVTEGGKVVVEWETASEVGTAGFYLHRYDSERGQYVQVNEALLPALFDSPQGGTYRLVDEGASFSQPNTYALVEVEQNGHRRVYGAYRVEVETGSSSGATEPLVAGSSRTPRRRQSAARQALGQLRGESRAAQQARRASLRLDIRGRRSPSLRQAVKIAVRERGIYSLGANELASLLGISPTEVSNLIGSGRLSLTNRGRPVAWLPASGNQGLLFYGEATDSIFTNDNIYWLTRRRGVTMGTVDAGAATPASGLTLTETTHQEENRFAATAAAPDPNADYWFWDGIAAGHPALGKKSFTVQAVGVAASPASATLTVQLHGATVTGAANEHQATVKLNGVSIGGGSWAGNAPHALSLSFPQSLLWEGGNTVEITGVLAIGVPFSIFYVNSFDLTYQRLYEAGGPAFFFRGEGYPAVTVTRFPEPGIALFDVSQPLNPISIRGGVEEQWGDGYALSFAPPSPGGSYLALSPSALKSPAAVWADMPSRLQAGGNQADYLILAAGELSQAAQALADYRAGQGLRSMVVDLEDIMDEFNFGIEDPRAVRTFLAYAYQNWRQAPRYVALAGAGTFDYKDYRGLGGNLFPPLMVRTPSGLFASDNAFGDVLGNDGVPEIAIGRLSALTAEELSAYIRKVQSFERSSGEGWAERVEMLADNPDRGTDFPADSERVAALVPPPYRVERIYLSEMTPDDAREALFGALAEGTGFINYLGHGGTNQLAEEGLLRMEDVEQLHNGERLPVLTAMTCTIGRFELPDFSSLAEALVQKPDGGAAAVWGPSGLSDNAEARLLNTSFFRSVFQQRLSVLGEAVLRALNDYAAQGGRTEMFHIYQLFGDPALRLKQPSSESGGTPGGESKPGPTTPE